MGWEYSDTDCKFGNVCSFYPRCTAKSEKECNIYISIWYNETHRGKIWFYLVECRNEYYTSDEQYQNDLLTYNMALNRAIEFIFTKILNCG